VTAGGGRARWHPLCYVLTRPLSRGTFQSAERESVSSGQRTDGLVGWISLSRTQHNNNTAAHNSAAQHSTVQLVEAKADSR